MISNQEQKPFGAVWRPVRDLEPDQIKLCNSYAREKAQNMHRVLEKLKGPKFDRSCMDILFREQKRTFAIETGQIEGLYFLRYGVAETLITEGFEGARGAHSAIEIDGETLRGLLEDQESALEMLFDLVKEGRPLTGSVIKEWHALLTRHQATATGIDPFGNRVEIPLRKGQYKIRPNNPRRQDGFVHEYCPPEHVQSEMDRFLEFHHGHRGLELAPELEAAWLHHEFVRIHPFQDGNGRISRLLMAYPFIKAGEFPPIIPARQKLDYITCLELADLGDLPPFVNQLGNLAAFNSSAAATRAELILKGRTLYRHANGGQTASGIYYPPEECD